MLRVASLIFSDRKPSTLTRDIDFVNKLRSKSPEILLDSRNVERNREEYRSRLDSSGETNPSDERALVRTEYHKDVPDGLKIEFAYKTLQVMGQVVKNFPLDLRGDLKVALATQSYELTLRTLRAFLEAIERHMPELLSLFDKALKRFTPFSRRKDDEIRDISQAAMMRFTEVAIFGTIKRLSLAIGVVDLKETYDQVRQSMGEENIPARLID
jgi:hypothetical protein